MLIAGDIGGTKTELAIFSNEGGPHSSLARVKVNSADYPSLEVIVKEFLAKVDKPVDRACFAVLTVPPSRVTCTAGQMVRATSSRWFTTEWSTELWRHTRRG